MLEKLLNFLSNSKLVRGLKLPHLGHFFVKHSYVDKVAEDLRATARKFEDPLVEHFFTLRDIKISRSTRAQHFMANAFFHISRSGFRIEFVSEKSRTGKVRQIEKPWSQSIGVTENRFELYLKDHSSVEFFPMSVQTHLYFSAFWQVFHDALNGGSLLLSNPVASGLGHRLREVANYIVENREVVGVNAAFDLSKVKSTVSDEEFSGYFIPKFPEVRDKVKRWRLVSKLGEGGFGQVFKVQHADTGELAALKLMSPKGRDGRKLKVNSPEFRRSQELFVDEAPLSMKVNSAFVVSALDYGTDPWPWILYPLIEGKDVIKGWLTSTEKEHYWWNLAHDLVAALDAIHAEGLVHKDVKPGNILAAKGRFVLLDFGVGEVAGYGGLLGIGISGTYGFIAPEVILLGPEKVSPSNKTDVFAAGMTLLSLFRQDDIGALRQAKTADLMREVIRRPIDLGGLPRDVSILLSRMVNYDPSKRAKTSELLKEIAKHVDVREKDRVRKDLEKIEFEFDPSELTRGTDQSFELEIPGPIMSWGPVEKEIARVVDVVRPRFFIIELNLRGSANNVYVQAISGEGNWILEAMSEKSGGVKQSDRTKANFMRLDWTPPSKSEPNYIVNSRRYATPEIVRRLTDAFEFGFEIGLRDIDSVWVTIQGTDKY